MEGKIADAARLGGENISSIALEAKIASHPKVLEAAVIGVPHPTWGEAPKVFVTLKEGVGGEQGVGEEIRRWAKSADAGLSGFMAPREVEVVAKLPKTATGKVMKGVLRAREMEKREGKGEGGMEAGGEKKGRESKL